jgi:hypothetical protein
LTRDEAFDLVKRATAAVAKGDSASPAATVRAEARKLLGRDSESLNERNFLRILHDAHDADLVDLRRRGSDYEVAVAVAAAPVDRQLEAAATANAPAPKPVAPVVRGMGSRGLGRGPVGGKGAIPAHLLNIGMVGAKPAAPAAQAPASATVAASTAEPLVLSIEEPKASEPAAKPARKRPAAKKAAKSAAAPKAAADAGAPAKKPVRAARKKTAAKTAGSES